MADENSENERGIVSVKAAISRYGGKVNQGTVLRNKSQKDVSIPEEMGSKAPELHIAKKKFDKINETRKITETVTSQAELELLKAKKVVRELTSQIEALKLKASDQTSQKPFEIENHRFIKMTRQLEILKRDVSKMKLDIERALEEKSRAENEGDAARLKLESSMKIAEKLRREIEEANEEEVLVELAQIQARKELAAIEAQKKEEQENFLNKIQEVGKKINVLRNEVEQAKQLNDVLEITKSEAVVLQNELNLIKEMDKRISSSENSQAENSEFQSVLQNLEAARKEQMRIKAGVFQIMTSMDLIRIDINNILEEKGQIQKSEAKTEKHIKKLNLKLLRAKDKLEATRASEGKAKLRLPSFDLSLQEFGKVKEQAQREHKCITEETVKIRDDIQEIESMTEITEGKLWDVMEELEGVKKAEGNALKKLQFLIERVVVDRALKNTDSITVSKFEYDYLTGSANGAKEIAGKKMAAANAWAEALRANVKEIKIRTELAKKEIKELKIKEERQLIEMEASLKTEETVENRSVRGKAMVENSYSLTPVRQARYRKSGGSQAPRRPIISTFWTVNRKRKVMGKIGNDSANEQTESEIERTGLVEES